LKRCSSRFKTWELIVRWQLEY